MNTRIKKLRKALDLTQQKFGERIDMKQNSVALIESGKRNVSDYAIRVICREFNVNEKWLRTGDGEMFITLPSSCMEALAEEYHLSKNEQLIIEKILELPENIRSEFVNCLLNAASEIVASTPDTETPSQRDARLLREEADAVEQEGERLSASLWENDA